MTSIPDPEALVDTNMLTAFADADHPRHADVRLFFGEYRRRVDLHVAPQSLYEYWVVATRPRGQQNGLGFSLNDVALDIGDFRQIYTVLPDPPGLLDEWLDLCRDHGVSGKNAHDARLAAYARLQRIDTLVTLNARDFARYGLTVVVP